MNKKISNRTSAAVALALIAVLLLSSVAFAAWAGPAASVTSFRGVYPDFYVSNPDLPAGNECATLDPSYIGLKINDPTVGVYTLESNGSNVELIPPTAGPFSASLTISIDALPTSSTLNWSSSFSGIQAVVMKGGPVANVYDYVGAGLTNVKDDQGLSTAYNGVDESNPGSAYGLSHVTFCFKDPTLAVTVGYVNASRIGGQVDFSWQTVSETGTAGFNIVADGAPLNAELIPSTVVDSVVPTDYSFSAVTDADVYYLEEVSIDGKVSQMGPYQVGVEYGSYVATDAIVPAIYLPLMQR